MADRELEMLVTVTSEEAYETEYFFRLDVEEDELIPFGE